MKIFKILVFIFLAIVFIFCCIVVFELRHFIFKQSLKKSIQLNLNNDEVEANIKFTRLSKMILNKEINFLFCGKIKYKFLKNSSSEDNYYVYLKGTKKLFTNESFYIKYKNDYKPIRIDTIASVFPHWQNKNRELNKEFENNVCVNFSNEDIDWNETELTFGEYLKEQK